MQHAIEEILAGVKISNDHLASLEKSFAEHPYSPSLAILLAKAYSLNDDIRFEEHIRKTAILTNNRKHLHDFLFSESSDMSETAETIDKDEVTETKVREVEFSEEEPNEAVEGEESDSVSIDPVEDNDPLFKQFITEAINAGAALDLLAEEPKLDEAPESALNHSKEEETLEPKENSIEDTKVEAPSRQSFSHWMNYLSDEEANSNSKPEQTHPLQTVFPRDAAEKKKVISIIDNFIEKEDSLVPKRAEFFNPSKAAKASLEDNDSVVTETLARIYAAQGNINKAISTYNKLSLLHPEKSSYFAALIEKLKSEKKDNKS